MGCDRCLSVRKWPSPAEEGCWRRRLGAVSEIFALAPEGRWAGSLRPDGSIVGFPCPADIGLSGFLRTTARAPRTRTHTSSPARTDSGTASSCAKPAARNPSSRFGSLRRQAATSRSASGLRDWTARHGARLKIQLTAWGRCSEDGPDLTRFARRSSYVLLSEGIAKEGSSRPPWVGRTGCTTPAVLLLRRLAAFAYFPSSHPRGARCAGLRETLGT